MPFEERRELTILGEVARQIAGDGDRAGDVPLAHLQVPQCERRFGVDEEVRVRVRRFTDGDQGPFPAAPAKDPPCAARHPGIDDVIDPCARDARTNVCRIADEHGVERLPGLPVLVPACSVAEFPQLQPDVVQIQLAEKEPGGLVRRVRLEARARELLALIGLAEERGHQVRTPAARLERLVFVMLGAQGGFELEEQRRGAQLERGEILRVPRAQLERQHRRGVVAAVIEEALRLGERRAIETDQRETEDCDQVSL